MLIDQGKTYLSYSKLTSARIKIKYLFKKNERKTNVLLFVVFHHDLTHSP